MSRLTIGIVAEGPTDSLLIEAPGGHILSEKVLFRPVQPPESDTPGFGVLAAAGREFGVGANPWPVPPGALAA